jgi:hypothetical protein
MGAEAFEMGRVVGVTAPALPLASVYVSWTFGVPAPRAVLGVRNAWTPAPFDGHRSPMYIVAVCVPEPVSEHAT